MYTNNDNINDSLTLKFELENRKIALEKRANTNRQQVTFGKWVGLGGLGAGVALGMLASPFVAVIAATVGVANYGLFALNEKSKTKEFRPFKPDQSFTDFLRSANKEERDYGVHEKVYQSIVDDALYLEDDDLAEWVLLYTSLDTIVNFMLHFKLEYHVDIWKIICHKWLNTYLKRYREDYQFRHHIAANNTASYILPTIRESIPNHYLLDSPIPQAVTRLPEIQPQTLSQPQIEVTPQTQVQPQIEVTPQTQVQPQIEVTPQTQVQHSLRLTGFSKVVENPFESRAIFGAQRTGKSFFAAVASSEIRKQRGTKIYHFNLASYGDEDSRYWNHCEMSLKGDLSMVDDFEAKHLVDRAINIVNSFYKDNNAILIVDEIAYIGSSSNRYKKYLEPLLALIADKISTLASSGKKRELAIWTIAPEFVAGGLVNDAKAVKKLSICYLAIPPGKVVKWGSQDVTFSQTLYDSLINNFSVAPVPQYGAFNCDRIVMIDNTWMPVGELPALPTYDEVEKMSEETALEILNQIKKESEAYKDFIPVAVEVESKTKKYDSDLIFSELKTELEQCTETNSNKVYDKLNLGRRYKGLPRPQFREIYQKTKA